MIRLTLIAAIVAALGAGLWRGAVWLREDARADLLREMVAAQALRDARDQSAKDRISQEIENESADELRARACALGMLPPDACPRAAP